MQLFSSLRFKFREYTNLQHWAERNTSAASVPVPHSALRLGMVIVRKLLDTFVINYFRMWSFLIEIHWQRRRRNLDGRIQVWICIFQVSLQKLVIYFINHHFSFFSYSGYTTGSTGWYLWSKKTSVQPARSVTTLTPTSPEPECPVVWRQWQPDDSNVGRIDKRRWFKFFFT